MTQGIDYSAVILCGSCGWADDGTYATPEGYRCSACLWKELVETRAELKRYRDYCNMLGLKPPGETATPDKEPVTS